MTLASTVKVFSAIHIPFHGEHIPAAPLDTSDMSATDPRHVPQHGTIYFTIIAAGHINHPDRFQGIVTGESLGRKRWLDG